MSRRTTIALLALGGLAAACSRDGSSSVTTVPVEVVTTDSTTGSGVVVEPVETTVPADDQRARLASGDDWSVAAALADVPTAGGRTFEVYLADIAQVASLFGLDRPASLDDVDAVVNEWILPLSFPGTPEYRELPVWIPLAEPLVPAAVRQVDEFDELVGWSVIDVDAYVHYQPQPPGYLLVATGTFGDDALAGLDEVAPGVVTTRDADDFATDFSEMSSLDRLGRAVRLARDGDHIAMSLATSLAERWLDGESETLADDTGLLAVAEALDAADVLTALLFRNDFAFVPGAGVTSAAQIEAMLALVDVTVPFDTVGIGWTVDAAGEPTVVVAYRALAAAGELAEQLRAAYTDGTSVVTNQAIRDTIGARDLNVSVEGAVVTVTYHPGERFWWSAVQAAVVQRDVPFVYR
ncbi:MAG TPA: hypothetical protein VNQ73_11690 [Ilumatobacter sp.]|nr:hypothetical protein [Ilumatobacter sp.]